MTTPHLPEDDSQDWLWLCDIHGTKFDPDEGVCPDCISEWHPINKEEDNATTSNG